MATPIEFWEPAASFFDARHQLLTDEHLSNSVDGVMQDDFLGKVPREHAVAGRAT